MSILELSHTALLEEALEKIDEAGREKVLRAVRMAKRAHEGAKGGRASRGLEGTQGIDHPVRVMYSLLTEQGVKEIDVLVTALLHDVLEISPVTKEEIAAEFGEKVAGWVDALTRKEGMDPKEYALTIKEAPFEVFLIELAARLDNLRVSYQTDRSRQPYFNETHRYYLLEGEHRSKEHPSLVVYTQAMRMMLEGD